MNRLPLRAISAQEKADYERDGVVNLSGMFYADWVERLRNAIQRDMDDPGPMATNFNAEGTPGRFFGDMFMWTRDPDFRAVFVDSAGPAIAAGMMGAKKVNVFYDQLFAKEPGTVKPTPWHQDQPYWAVKGWQVTTLWIALDTIDRDNGAVVNAGPSAPSPSLAAAMSTCAAGRRGPCWMRWWFRAGSTNRRATFWLRPTGSCAASSIASRC